LYAELGAVSVAIWIYRLAALGANRTWLGCAGTATGWQITTRSSSNLTRFQSNLTTVKNRESSTILALGAWTHLVLRDSALGNVLDSTIDFVFNGAVEAGTSIGNGTGTKTTGTPTLLTAGAQANGAGAPFYVGPIAIWGRKIGDNEARQLFLGASPRDFSSGLVGHWGMDGSEGHALEPDLSGVGFPLVAFSTAAPRWGPPAPRWMSVPRRTVFAPTGSGITADASLPVPLQISAAAALTVQADAAIPVSLGISATAALAVQADAAMAVPLGTSATAALAVAAVATMPVPLGFNATAALTVTADATLPVPLGFTGVASLGGLGADATLPVPIGFSATATLALAADAALALPLSLSATAAVQTLANAVLPVSLAFIGTAALPVAAAAVLAASLRLSGTIIIGAIGVPGPEPGTVAFLSLAPAASLADPGATASLTALGATASME